jgi:hypothetical protein
MHLVRTVTDLACPSSFLFSLSWSYKIPTLQPVDSYLSPSNQNISENVTFPPYFYFTSNERLLVRKFHSFVNIIPQQNFQIALWNSVPPQKFVWQ